VTLLGLLLTSGRAQRFRRCVAPEFRAECASWHSRSGDDRGSVWAPPFPVDVACRLCPGGRRLVLRLPAVVQDVCGYLGWRGPGVAGLGHAARELAAARLDPRGRDLLHNRNPRV